MQIRLVKIQRAQVVSFKRAPTLMAGSLSVYDDSDYLISSMIVDDVLSPTGC